MNWGIATSRGLWRHAYREGLKPRTLAVVFATVALLLATVTIFRPLGTSTLTHLHRLGYWAACAAVSFPVCYATATMTLYIMRRGSLVTILPAAAASVLIEGLICTTVVTSADVLFRPDAAGSESLWTVYTTVTVVVAVCTFFGHYVVLREIRHASPAADEPPAPPGSGPPRPEQAPATGRPPLTNTNPANRPSWVLDRLTREVNHDIIYMKMADHYVEVFTAVGSCLVRMRFSEAVAGLGDRGMQVHRSYWVARGHARHLLRRDGRTLLRLAGDHLVPVSRPYVEAVRALVSNRRRDVHD